MTNEMTYRTPDWLYVSKLLRDLQWEQQGLHYRVKEIEALRYYEDLQPTTPTMNPSGRSNVKVGMTDKMVETVKASLLANVPKVEIEPQRQVETAQTNADKRREYWQSWIESRLGGANTPNYIAELVDSQLMGLGIWKTAYDPSVWGPSTDRKRRRGESAANHVDRVRALKRRGGHPGGDIIVHPLSIHFRPGVGARVDEVVEHSYKSKQTVFNQYDLFDSTYRRGAQGTRLSSTTASIQKLLPGQPHQFISALPSGVNVTNYVLVTEYWNPECYQVYVNGQKVHEEVGMDVSVAYFIAPGRSSSSKDPDKYSMSIAENLRHNEPEINTALNRMVEATDLIVNRRNTLEVPESYTAEVDEDEKEGTTRPRVWSFTSDKTEALPAGAKLVDPFANAHAVFEFLPVLNLMMQVAQSHSENELLRGISPGAAGSGYRDNSLYMMAQSQFFNILQTLQNCIAAIIIWQEEMIVKQAKQEVWCGGYSITPADITDFPVTITVKLKPQIPQNLIANGTFWESMRASGNVSRRYVRQMGLDIEDAGDMQDEVDQEEMFEQIKPYLNMKVIGMIMGNMNGSQPGAAGGGSGLVDTQGQPLSSGDASASNPLNALLGMGGGSGGRNGAGREVGRQLGGRATGGQPKQQPEPTAFPITNRNGQPSQENR